MTLLVTGAAGFVGFHLSRSLLSEGASIIGIDSLNDYYDVSLKLARLEQLKGHSNFEFIKLDLADRAGTEALFQTYKPQAVVHLAAQAGVRYSLKNPHAYLDSNLAGFLNILEGCRHCQPEHLVFASSSSVYGNNKKVPFSTDDFVDHPVSLYAATKKSNELMAHAYSHLYDIPTTGLRFFTVYGPWGRPDMAYFLFTKAIFSGQPIKVFNRGYMQRDFTYIDDIVEGVKRVLKFPPVPGTLPADQSEDRARHFTTAPYRIFNLGNNQPVALLHFIELLETHIGKPAHKEFLPMQPGDVPTTFAEIDDLEQAVGFKPQTPLEEGLGEFVRWYRHYYGV